MKKFIIASMATLAAAAVSLPASAANWVIDFDTASDGSTLAANTIFGDGSGTSFQRYDSAAGGVFNSNGVALTINAESHFGWGEIDLATGFDSSGASGNSRDPDLLQNFNQVTVGGVTPDANGYRNILIVQSSENSFTKSCADGTTQECDNNRADDEARGGRLYFDFDTAVDLVGMNVFDTESNQGGTVWFWDSEGDLIDTLTMPTTGDRGVAFMDFGGVAQDVALMKVKFYGSGAIDNITGNSPDDPQVPEPGAAALFGIGMIGLTALRRRRKIAA